MAKSVASSTVISTKGQVILPKAIRAQKNWAPGTRLVAETTPEGVLLRPENPFPRTRPEDVRGCLSANGKHIAIEDFDRLVGAAVKRAHGRD